MTNHHQTCIFPDMPNAFLFTVPLLHASSLSFESADRGRKLRPQTLCFIDVMFSFSISSVSWNIIVLLPLSVTCFSPLDLYSFDFIFILQSIFKGKKIKQTKDFYSFICFKFYHLPYFQVSTLIKIFLYTCRFSNTTISLSLHGAAAPSHHPAACSPKTPPSSSPSRSGKSASSSNWSASCRTGSW